MTVSNKDLVNGKESAVSEAKRLFSQINFGKMTKSEFVAKMIDGLTGNASQIYVTVKHLEAVWRGKAAPTNKELKKAQKLGVDEETSATPPLEKSLKKMGITNYVPKYAKTQELKDKMQKSK
jgi:hypothetical protein